MLNDNKAGMEGLDKEAINKLIFEASKGSLYFEREEQKQNIIKKRISDQNLQLNKFTDIQINESLKKADMICSHLISEINLNKIIVHVDMDAFYAAVEILDRPDLKDKPMAVGSQSMLSTSNYAARRFGVRAAMPGFIAKKLCPHLIILPPDFKKYGAMSKKVHQVLSQYDENFSPVGLDEAYLDITNIVDEVLDVLKINSTVEEIRNKIFEATNLTASAGIAANGMLAKICSDKNKPNGQFYLPNNQQDIMAFIENLPVRKVNGIGKVSEMILKELGVITCRDLYTNRATLQLLYSENMFEYFMQIAHGIGSSCFESNGEKKSLSAERTFCEKNLLKDFQIMLRDLSEQVSDALVEEGLECKTITVKMKTTKFEVKTKARSLQNYTNDFEIINEVAVSILKHELQSQNLCLRLLGVRASTLQPSLPNKPQINIKNVLLQIASIESAESQIICPICSFIIPSNIDINSHIDNCLNKGLIKNIISEQKSPRSFHNITVMNNKSKQNIYSLLTDCKKEHTQCPVAITSLTKDDQSLNKNCNFKIEAISPIVKSEKENTSDLLKKEQTKFTSINSHSDVASRLDQSINNNPTINDVMDISIVSMKSLISPTKITPLSKTPLYIHESLSEGTSGSNRCLISESSTKKKRKKKKVPTATLR